MGDRCCLPTGFLSPLRAALLGPDRAGWPLALLTAFALPVALRLG